jgi:hypothetical protein
VSTISSTVASARPLRAPAIGSHGAPPAAPSTPSAKPAARAARGAPSEPLARARCAVGSLSLPSGDIPHSICRRAALSARAKGRSPCICKSNKIKPFPLYLPGEQRPRGAARGGAHPVKGRRGGIRCMQVVVVVPREVFLPRHRANASFSAAPATTRARRTVAWPCEPAPHHPRRATARRRRATNVSG